MIFQFSRWLSGIAAKSKGGKGGCSSAGPRYAQMNPPLSRAGYALSCHLLLVRLPLRDEGDVDALPGDVVLPAVVEAPDPALLVHAEEERREPVGAVGVDEADLVLRVAEQDQVFIHDAHANGRAVRLGALLRQSHGSPEPAEELAHRRSGARLRQQFILFLRQHIFLSSVTAAGYTAIEIAPNSAGSCLSASSPRSLCPVRYVLSAIQASISQDYSKVCTLNIPVPSAKFPPMVLYLWLISWPAKHCQCSFRLVIRHCAATPA